MKQLLLEFEQAQEARNQGIAANDHLHGLYAHTVALCWYVILQRLHCELDAAIPLQPHCTSQQWVQLPRGLPASIKQHRKQRGIDRKLCVLDAARPLQPQCNPQHWVHLP